MCRSQACWGLAGSSAGVPGRGGGVAWCGGAWREVEGRGGAGRAGAGVQGACWGRGVLGRGGARLLRRVLLPPGLQAAGTGQPWYAPALPGPRP